MANYANLKAAISQAIKTNGNQEITGQVLQDVLNSIVSVIGANYTFAGVATPGTNPGTPDQNVVYLAMEGGTYTNFNAMVLSAGISLLMWNGSWTSETVMYGDGGVFDISVYKSSGGTLATFADLAAALDGGNNIPVGVRKGGMSIKFVCSSDNNYIQYRCIADEFTTDVTQWQKQGAEVTVSQNTPTLPLWISNTAYKKGNQVQHDSNNYSCKQDHTSGTTFDSSKWILLSPFISAGDYRQFIHIGESNIGIIPSSIKINGWGTNPALAPNIGDILYYTGCNALYVRVAESGGIMFHTLPYYDDTIYLYDNNLYVWNGCDLILSDTVSAKYNVKEDYPTLLASHTYSVGDKISYNSVNWECTVSHTTSAGGYFDPAKWQSCDNTGKNQIIDKDKTIDVADNGKIIKFVGMGTVGAGNSGVTKVGDIYYNTALKKICECVTFTSSTSFTHKIIPYYDGAIYTYQNMLYIWDGTKLVNKTPNPNDIPYIDSDIAVKSSGLYDIISKLVKGIANINIITPINNMVGKWIDNNGTEQTNANFGYLKYEVVPLQFYTFSGKYGQQTGINFVGWLDENNAIIRVEPYHGESSVDMQYIDQVIQAPANARYLYLNYRTTQIDLSNVKLCDLSQNIYNYDKATKVVIKNTNPNVGDIMFYIRAKYNDTKDIIITHTKNSNNLISFANTYIGGNNLDDVTLISDNYKVSEHTDSTAPLFNCTQYWHLFAQHGYCIPYVNNGLSLTQSDLGTEWTDQLDRKYTIGRITSSNIYLLPQITTIDGHDIRSWKTPSDTEITSLSEVGTSRTFNVSNKNFTQLYPLMTHSDRIFQIDGKQITDVGEYYCNEFKVSESQIGYDPASIQDFFGASGVDLTDANIMAKFTFCYNYCGAQCCINTTIDVRKEIECKSYGAIQQEFFYNQSPYKAKFFVPKAKTIGGVDFEKGFFSENASAAGYTWYRNATTLNDVDKPIDRMIGVLVNTNDNTHKVGMAAGVSLVNGDTITSKRNENCEIGNDYSNRLGSIYPAGKNKFYVAGINTAKYNGYFPNTLFKEINCYVSYFDPDTNIGQVYWYKDGNSYVIYAHYQSLQNRVAINVPQFMEGLSLSVVEKTANAELLTETVQNGKFFVNYNSDDANYIVLIAE